VIEQEFDVEDLEIEREPAVYEIGDQVVYPHHGAGKVLKKEMKEVLGENREYLTIKILHNDMTVMVPCCNADKVASMSNRAVSSLSAADSASSASAVAVWPGASSVSSG
jgi:RNA polymerase-interacting CarD/CdnL/TRCF family regulator